MTQHGHTQNQRSEEILRRALARAADLSTPPAAGHTTARWVDETSSVGELSALAALALLKS